MLAWNHGADMASVPYTPADAPPGTDWITALGMSAATAAALAMLGRELFGAWAARGYAAARATQPL